MVKTHVVGKAMVAISYVGTLTQRLSISLHAKANKRKHLQVAVYTYFEKANI